MVRAPDLKSERRWFKSRSEHYLELFSVARRSTPRSATLVNSQLACLPPVGVLKAVMLIWIISFIVPEKSFTGSGHIYFI